MIDRIEYSIVDRCNLNCKYCCHYAPVVNEYEVTVEQFEEDVHNLSVLTNEGKELGTLGILGGEPLMHPKFMDICKIAREQLPWSRIRVTTNGILLLSMSKQHLAMLRRLDVEILISKYSDKIDYKHMENLLNEYHIVYKFCQNNDYVTFYKYSIDEKGTMNAEWMHNLCTLWKEKPYYTCHELRDGRLYPCSQIARAEYLNKLYGLNLPTSDFIVIRNKSLQEVEEFLNKCPDMCRYCKVEEWNVPKGTWQKSEGKKEEFI